MMRLVAVTAIAAGLALSHLAHGQYGDPAEAADAYLASNVCDARYPTLDSQVKVLVTPGTKLGAKDYYARVSRRIGLPLDVGQDGTTLTDLIAHLGYPGLSATDLEVEPPNALVPVTEAARADLALRLADSATFLDAVDLADFASDAVIPVRYFAPKVADYDKILPGANPGWRKLVRLRSLEDSAAKTAGVKAAWVLFNELHSPTRKPFDVNEVFPTRADIASKGRAFANAIQVILECDVPEGQTSDGPALHFLSFVGLDPISDEGLPPYGLSYTLRANFDRPGVYPEQTEKNLYFLPAACVQCHGGRFRGATMPAYADPVTGNRGHRLKLNYLDTDHWLDARESGDFFVLSALDVPVLIDAAPADGSEYEDVFDRFRRLNSHILAQNRQSDLGGAASLQTRSATVWEENHKSSSSHVDRWHRQIGTPEWDPDDSLDAELLPVLERYCARCHVTMMFSIYDKGKVTSLATFSQPQDRLAEPPTSKHLFEQMPQGRPLGPVQRKRLICALNRLAGLPVDTDCP